MIVIRIVLTLYFVSSILKGVNILRRKHSMDKMVFASLGLVPLFFAIVIVLIGLHLTTVVYLWFAFPWGAYAGFLAIFLGWAETIFGIIYTHRNPETAAAFSRASREERGLKDMGAVPQGDRFMRMMVAIASAPAIFWAMLLLFLQLNDS